ncbi:unnamed protein product [Rotaria socialis]|uniref:Uncharacterized protein n=1 Tax=Rotaria socialis TaxID=392032 RepID=A0A817X452_9BILA|nr:unnamed protein product [Rotaria socialis]CAF3364593.1 unnamed protein product [Rotaria socialis]CAF3492934.1 unnamed protein product [Rotaria socialis]CAF3701898.1 unnamed protein product [Rotaria socialis]CAF3705725.1 unnamed protein product [Rotaria socialis]
MATSRFLTYLTIMIVMFLLIEQSYEFYVDCQTRCLLESRLDRNRDTLKMCRDECELLGLLQQDDANNGRNYKYKMFN